MSDTDLVRFKFIDFFAGIGGFRSGLEKAGMKCVGYCEIDKYARRSYEALYDTTGEWMATDITEVKGYEIPNADLWTFGFPCQDISIAGLQKGMTEETRSGLFYQIMRCLDEREQSNQDKPEWIIAENVKNLLSHKGGWTFYDVLTEMDKRGYDLWWRNYNSKDYGVPQNRERIYIIGHLRKRGRRELLCSARKSSESIKQIGNLLEPREKWKNPQEGRVYDPKGIAPTLMADGSKSPKIIVKGHIEEWHQRGGIYQTNGIAPTLLATMYKSPPLISGENDNRVRKLTPKECWRLQGFTDEQFNKAAALNSNTQLYKQAGNSVTVSVVEAIGNMIMNCENNNIKTEEYNNQSAIKLLNFIRNEMIERKIKLWKMEDSELKKEELQLEQWEEDLYIALKILQENENKRLIREDE